MSGSNSTVVPYWSPRAPNEKRWLALDFAQQLPPGVTLTGPPTVAAVPPSAVTLGTTALLGTTAAVFVTVAPGVVSGTVVMLTFTGSGSDGSVIPRSGRFTVQVPL